MINSALSFISRNESRFARILSNNLGFANKPWLLHNILIKTKLKDNASFIKTLLEVFNVILSRLSFEAVEPYLTLLTDKQIFQYAEFSCTSLLCLGINSLHQNDDLEISLGRLDVGVKAFDEQYKIFSNENNITF